MDTFAAEPVSKENIVKLRKEAAHRPRRIIFDNDGNEVVYYAKEATREAILECRTTPLDGSQVDTIVYCTWSSGFSYFTHNTKVGELFTSTAIEPGKGPDSGFSKNKTQQLVDKGLDALEIIVTWCHEHDVEAFWSMRMNDIHDAWNGWYSPYLFPPIKKEHPDWLLGSEKEKPVNGAWTAIDYGRPEVRDLAFRFFEEVCNNYDVDGVQMDFFRHLNYFRTPASGKPATQEELDMMTDLVRRIRTMADDVGAKRGRPILISVRVPDSVELCKNFGFDIERWMAEDLIDIITASGYFRVNPWETTVELAHKHNVVVWPTLSETRLRDPQARKLRASLECYRGRALEAWNADVDGIYMFNFFNPNSPLWWQVGAPETAKAHDRLYTTGARAYGNISFWWDGGEKYMNRSVLNPEHPQTLGPGTTKTIELAVGEDLAESAPQAVTLRIRVKELAEAESLAVALNREALPEAAREGDWLTYPVEAALVRRGANAFAITLSEGAKAKVVLQDLLLKVKQ